MALSPTIYISENTDFTLDRCSSRRNSTKSGGTDRGSLDR